jgi:excisionase family DNA binding protein
MDASSEFPEMMDTHQVAAYLRIKERKVYDLLKERRIPCTRVTGKWLFPKTEIDNWLKQNSQAPRSGPAGLPPMVVAGSHDPLLEWALREVGSGLAMLPGGSGDGLARMAAGEAALAGLHLLDAESGEYNIPQAKAHLAGTDVVLVEWARRRQGIVVARGNPLGIAGVADLARPGVRVAMRQEGSGSHALLEHLLGLAGLDLGRLNLALSAARSETDLGLAVLAGSTDAGLAVESVARSLQLDFVPLAEECFDLAIARAAYFEPPVQALMAFARTSEFAARAAAFGGYDIARLGAIRWNST